MAYTNDPIADFNSWDREQQKQLEKLPRCADCDRPIQDDYCYLINDEPICQNCLDAGYRKDIDLFI
jgi:formylmethanofuran dehydrogenase subunit E